MAVERIESERYPYVPISVRVGEQTQAFEALVDTGLEGDTVVPEATVFAESPNEYRRWTFVDGSVVEAPVYYGVVQVGTFEPVPARIARLGEETVIGRGIIDQYWVIFDHGERVIVEP